MLIMTLDSRGLSVSRAFPASSGDDAARSRCKPIGSALRLAECPIDPTTDEWARNRQKAV